MRRGFTLVELVLVMGILVLLMGIGTISLMRTQGQESVLGVEDTLIADLKAQQTKAMIGQAQGIYWETGQYTLFVGNSYSAGSPTNQVITLPSGTTISSTRSASTTFSHGTGEVTGVDVITLQQATGQSRTVRLNTYGAVVAD